MDASAALLSSPFPSFQLRWSPSEHPALWHSFHASLKQGLFVDVTLMAAPKNKDREIIDPVNVDDDDDDEDEAGGEEGVKAHQLLLSAVSPFFRNILLEQRHTAHPIIILPAGIPLRDVRYLLEFVYGGKVMVPKEQLLSVLKTAAQLEIKGLSGNYNTSHTILPVVATHSTTSPAPKDADNQSAEASLDLTLTNGVGKKAAKKRKLTSEGDSEEDSDGRPGSRASSTGGTRRKSEPKYHFLKQKRKSLRPSKIPGDEEDEEERLIDDEMEAEDLTKANGNGNNNSKEEEEEIEVDDDPIDFTYKPSTSSAAAVAGLVVPGERKSSTESASDDAQQRLADLSTYFGLPDMSALSEEHQALLVNIAKTKDYSKKDLGLALDALKSKTMTLSKASELYKIPPTTLWQRANKLGIATAPRKAEPGSVVVGTGVGTTATNKTWTDADLNNALAALRKKEISANKASKVYGIPSSTLYKIARREGIELAQPFNAVQTSWTQHDLNCALEAIRQGLPVQKAATEYGIPSGTLYGRCKKVGIGLSKTATAHWSEGDMKKALDTVKNGTMSINQAAINFQLPYSSLYGRINRLKRDNPVEWQNLNLAELGAVDGAGAPGQDAADLAGASAAAIQELSSYLPAELLEQHRLGNMNGVFPATTAAAAVAAAAAAAMGSSPSMVTARRLLDPPPPAVSAATVLSVPRPAAILRATK